MNIVQVKHFHDNTRYTFEVPKGFKLYKDDIVKVDGIGFDKICVCVTDSVEVSDIILDMIMMGKRVTAKVIGKYSLENLETKEKRKPKVRKEE